jgi:hypothetical protein
MRFTKADRLFSTAISGERCRSASAFRCARIRRGLVPHGNPTSTSAVGHSRHTAPSAVAASCLATEEAVPASFAYPTKAFTVYCLVSDPPRFRTSRLSRGSLILIPALAVSIAGPPTHLDAVVSGRTRRLRGREASRWLGWCRATCLVVATPAR